MPPQASGEQQKEGKWVPVRSTKGVANVEARRGTGRTGHAIQMGPLLAMISWTTRPQMRERRLYRDGGIGAMAREGGIKGGGG
ncbi:hypothetical protein FCV25MIE_03465 [Fagus crenata]